MYLHLFLLWTANLVTVKWNLKVDLNWTCRFLAKMHMFSSLPFFFFFGMVLFCVFFLFIRFPELLLSFTSFSGFKERVLLLFSLSRRLILNKEKTKHQWWSRVQDFIQHPRLILLASPHWSKGKTLHWGSKLSQVSFPGRWILRPICVQEVCGGVFYAAAGQMTQLSVAVSALEISKAGMTVIVLRPKPFSLQLHGMVIWWEWIIRMGEEMLVI